MNLNREIVAKLGYWKSDEIPAEQSIMWRERFPLYIELHIVHNYIFGFWEKEFKWQKFNRRSWNKIEACGNLTVARQKIEGRKILAADGHYFSAHLEKPSTDSHHHKKNDWF